MAGPAGTPPAGQPAVASTPAAPATPTAAAVAAVTPGTAPAVPVTPAPPPAAPAAPVVPAGAPALTTGGDQGPEGTPAQKLAASAGEVVVTLPDGVVLDEETVKAFSTSAKEWGLTSEQASKAAGFYAEQLQAQEDSFTTLNKEWAKTLEANTEFGGENFAANAALMRRVVEELGGKELVDGINLYRLGNFPPLVNLIWKARGLVKEGSSLLKGAPPSGSLDSQQQLRRDYPSMYNEDGSPK